MVIRFQNLGKIKETELDLRQLTVIIGPNNSNKTYLAYSVYGLWQSLSDFIYPIPTLLELKKATDGTLSFTVNKENYHTTLRDLDATAAMFTEDLGYFYQDSSDRLFSETQLHVEVAWEEYVETLAYFSGKYFTTVHIFSKQA